MRFQRLSPSHFSGWTQRWRTSTSLISQMVSTCCTASALSPGFQHERSRLFRKSAAISSSRSLVFERPGAGPSAGAMLDKLAEKEAKLTELANKKKELEDLYHDPNR